MLNISGPHTRQEPLDGGGGRPASWEGETPLSLLKAFNTNAAISPNRVSACAAGPSRWEARKLWPWALVLAFIVFAVVYLPVRPSHEVRGFFGLPPSPPRPPPPGRSCWHACFH